MDSKYVLWLAGDSVGWKLQEAGDGYHLYHDPSAKPYWCTREHVVPFDRFREDVEQFLRDAAAADTHSSDRDPGAVDPWEDR
jgi:hypothetical protein